MTARLINGGFRVRRAVVRMGMSTVITYLMALVPSCLAATFVLSAFSGPELIDIGIYFVVTLVATTLVIGPGLVILAIRLLRPYFCKRKNPVRYARLERLSQSEDFVRRLPHRFLEWKLWGSTEPYRDMKKLLPQLPPKTFVLLDRQKKLPISIPKFTEFFFEPIDIDDDKERMFALEKRFNPYLSAFLEETPDDVQSEPEEPTDSQTMPTKVLRRGLGIACLIILIPVMIIYLLLMVPTVIAVFLVVSGLGLLIGWVVSLFHRQTVFLVPGGIAVRITRFAAHSADLFRLTRHDSALVWFDHKIHCQTKNGKYLNFRYHYSHETLLAVWLSQIQPPTPEQLASLLDPAGAKN